MDITSRSVFLAGATSGIGLELARRFRAAGSTVVIGGRRAGLLRDLAAEGFGTVEIDVADDASVARARDEVLAQLPALDVLVTMAGILPVEDLRDPAHFATARETLDVNVLGTIRVIDAFTPHLLGQGRGAIVTVSSGIGFLPFPAMPSYGASKAAVHAYSESLRAQLEGTGIEVAELVPPAVATVPEATSANPHALDLDDYASEVMDLISQDPTPHEILVQGVLMHRWAERDGSYARLVAQRAQTSRAMLSAGRG